jgi:hypothetical protein
VQLGLPRDAGSRLSPAGNIRRHRAARAHDADRRAGPLLSAGNPRAGRPRLGRRAATVFAALRAQLGHRRLHRSRHRGCAVGRARREHHRRQSAACLVPARCRPREPVQPVEPAVSERAVSRHRGNSRFRGIGVRARGRGRAPVAGRIKAPARRRARRLRGCRRGQAVAARNLV